MNILKKLATPFIAVWRWIKETAWVQPLLIVGIIFGVIFSIPSITSWVQSWDFGDDTYTWLKNNQLSLKGITDVDTKGEAATFFDKYSAAQQKWSNKDKAGAQQELKDYVGNSNKMFLYFVNEDSNAEAINEANSYLVKEAWNTKVVDAAKKAYGEEKYKSYAQDFKYQTIFVDEVVDKKDPVYETMKPFDYLVRSGDYETFYSSVDSVGKNSPYRNNIVKGNYSTIKTDLSSYKTSIENLISPSGYTGSIPALFILDLTENNTTDSIISNVVFTIEGADKYEKSTFLAHAWIGTEEFSNTL